MSCDPDEVIKRLDLEITDRKVVEQVWDSITQYIAPHRGNFFDDIRDEGAVQWRELARIFDSTAVMDAVNLAASLQGNLTSPSIKWFHMRFRDDDLNQNVTAKTWLEECESRVYYELQESNFNLEMSEGYADLVTYGNSFIVEEAEFKNGAYAGLKFQSIPIPQVYFNEDSDDDVHELWRVLKWTAVQIADKFGMEGLPQKVKDLLDAGRTTERMDVVFYLYRREENRDANVFTQLAPDKRPFGGTYILKCTAEQLGEEAGYYEMPSFVTRWRKTCDSKWGNSPAHYALADVLTLNRLVELDLRAREKAVDPPTITTENGLMSDLDMQPGGWTVVRAMEDIAPFESRARFDATNDKIQQLQESIHRYFYIDQLMLKESPSMTATEVNARIELMQRVLAPTLGRLVSDLLDPLIQRTFRILLRAGALPEMPEVVQGADMDVTFLGPLARAQQSDTVMNLERFTAFTAQLAQINPQVLALVNWEDVLREAQQSMGAPTTVMKTEDEVEAERQAAEQQQQQQQAMMQAAQSGQVMQSVGEGMQAVQGIDPAQMQELQAAIGGV